VLVLMQEPVVPFSFLRAKPIGVMQMVDQGEQDDKIIGGWGRGGGAGGLASMLVGWAAAGVGRGGGCAATFNACPSHCSVGLVQ
jgi:hypothetical protein